jgi:hypothetical protein
MKIVTHIKNKIELRIMKWDSTKNPNSAKKLGFLMSYFFI